MLIQESRQNLPKVEASRKKVIGQVEFSFIGFEAITVEVDLRDPEQHQFKDHLKVDENHNPEKVTLICEDSLPMLAVIEGRETKFDKTTSYLHLVLANPDKENVACLENTNFSKFKNNGGKGLNLISHLTDVSDDPGRVKISKVKENFLVEVFDRQLFPSHSNSSINW